MRNCSTFPSRAKAWTPIYLPVAADRAVVPKVVRLSQCSSEAFANPTSR
jgi:hypothetical protein